MLCMEVYYQNGESVVTKFNGSIKEAEDYYLGKTFNIGSDSDNLQVCTGIRFLNSGGQDLFKSAKRGGMSVRTLCLLINGNVHLMDNGNGQPLETSDARRIAKSEYAVCLVETVTAVGDAVVLWLPRK